MAFARGWARGRNLFLLLPIRYLEKNQRVVIAVQVIEIFGCGGRILT